MVSDRGLPGAWHILVSGSGILQLVEQTGGVAGERMVLCAVRDAKAATDPEYKVGMELAANYLKRSGYRLPTETEVEFATRAGSVTSRYYGETEELLPKYAWYNKNGQDRCLAGGE